MEIWLNPTTHSDLRCRRSWQVFWMTPNPGSRRRGRRALRQRTTDIAWILACSRVDRGEVNELTCRKTSDTALLSNERPRSEFREWRVRVSWQDGPASQDPGTANEPDLDDVGGRGDAPVHRLTRERSYNIATCRSVRQWLDNHSTCSPCQENLQS